MDHVISSSPPMSPRANDVWVDVHGRHFVWTLNSDGYGQWVQVPVQRDVATPSPMTVPITNPTPKCTSAPTPPLGPQANDLWFDTTTGFFFIFYNDGNTYQWVVTNPGRGSDVVPPSSVAPVLLNSDPGIVLTPDPFIGIGSVGVDTAWFDARVASEIPANLPPSGAAGGDLAGSYPNPVVKASVALGGNPTATTQATSDSSQRLATTAFVKTNIAALPAPPATLPPSGVAGGDLSGSYPNPTIKPGTNTQLLTTVGGVAAWAAPPSTAPSGAAGGALSGTYPNPGLAVPYPTTLPPSGAAGGGLTGTYPNPTLVGGPLSNYALTSSIPTTLPPSGAAGGALTGTYPNPTLVGGPLSNYALTSSIPTTLPPSGAAGGALTGTYPNPTLVGGPLSNYALTSSIPTTLPPNGAAGGDLSGTYPNPTIKPGTNTQVLTTVAGVAAWAAASGGGAATFVGTTPPGSPTDGQLWYYSDAVNGGGTLYIRYNDGNSTAWVPASPVAAASQTPLDGYLYGMTLSNNSTTGINFAPGKFADSNNATLISNPTSMNKLISATWAAGTGNGGLGNGITRTASTWYHMFGGLVSGVFDAFYDTSVVGANAPAGFTNIRRLGSVRTSTGAPPPITPFIQNGDWFEWATWALDLTVNPLATAATNRLIRTPLGIVVMARTNCQLTNGDTVTVSVAISNPAVATPNTSIYQLVTGPNNSVATQIDCPTNTASQIESQMQGGTPASNTLYITTVGWFDTRGRTG